MKKALALTLLTLGVLGCGSSGELQLPEEQTHEEEATGTEDVTLTDVTNRDACAGPATEYTNFKKGIWFEEFQGSDGMKRKYIYEFDEDSIFLKASCEGDGIQLFARLGLPAVITPNTIQISEGDFAQNRAPGLSGQERVCRVESEATGVMNYRFVGPCLEIEYAGGTKLLVPSY